MSETNVCVDTVTMYAGHDGDPMQKKATFSYEMSKDFNQSYVVMRDRGGKVVHRWKTDTIIEDLNHNIPRIICTWFDMKPYERRIEMLGGMLDMLTMTL